MYAERAAELNQPALSITDHGSLAGTLYHMQACESVGIKAILGMEAYFRPSIEEDRENKKPFGYFHLVMLAQNMTGWQNLMRISSQSHDDHHFYQSPSVDWKLLKDNSSGIIVTSSCISGYIPDKIKQQDFDSVNKHITEMQNVYGDRFYFEIQPHDFDDQRYVNQYIVELAKAKGIPFVATSDAHSPYEDWTDTQGIRVKIAWNKGVKGEDAKEYGGVPTTYLMSEDELRESFAAHHSALSSDEIDEAIKTSVDIADRCDQIVVDRSPKVPKAAGSILEAERILREWCEEGMERIGKKDDDVYRARLEEELSVMKKLKVLDYFVFVGDMVRWAKSQNIRVGPGRGSAGGSLVCYLSRITALDPIGYNLLFERFLNEYRTEIPDIDVDFDPNGRPLIKEYLTKKWGADKVIDVAAFQSFGLKAAVKDVARTLGVDFQKTTKATDSIPDKTWGETLETLSEQLPELNDFFEEFPNVKRHACRLQGQIKGSSKHPAAVIVTDQPAENLIPLMRAKDGGLVTQWSERANHQLLSPYGFLKVDMLVTKALAQQARAFDLIRERHGIDCENVNDFFEDVYRFPVNQSPLLSDPEVVSCFGHGRNLGIFQFASRGISGLLKEIAPTNLDHVIAANALYRPGTLSNGMAFEFAKRKNGKEWRLPHESVAPFLSSTFAIIVYQEQVMQMYRTLGVDVDSSESAVFLKVVAKGIARDLKGKEKLQAYYDKFAGGCKEKGIPKQAYDEIWDQILAMTTYSFNRSHSAGYALQAYQDWWLKKRYPLEFYEPLLTNEEGKTAQIVRESRAFGLDILPPDINESNQMFTVSGNSIRFGLMAVKGVADAGYQEISRNRRYTSLADFEQRVAKRKVNAKAKQALIECGAFDSLGERAEWAVKEKASAERQIIGIALSSGDDIKKYQKIIDEHTDPIVSLDRVMEEEGIVRVGGEIVKTSEHKTKKGDPYIRVDLDCAGDTIQAIFWSEEYSKYRHVLYEGAVVLVAGSYDTEWENVSAHYCVTAEQLATEIKKEKKDASRSVAA